MLRLQSPFVQRRTLTAEPLAAELVPLPVNLRGFVPRIAAVTQAELDGVALSYLNALAEQQRREGGVS